MTTTPQRRATSSPGITSLIPARIDRLPWSGFCTYLVAALGVARTLNGLEITIASNAGPDLIDACNTGAVAELTQAATREGLDLHAVEMDLSSQPSAGAAVADDAPVNADAAALALERDLGLAEPDRVLLTALIRVAVGLLERHAGNGRAEAALTCDAANLPGQATGQRHHPANRPGRTSCSPRARLACCATCRPIWARQRSPPSSTSRRTRSRPTCGTCTASSARTAARRPCSAPRLSACSRSPPAGAGTPDGRTAARKGHTICVSTSHSITGQARGT